MPAAAAHAAQPFSAAPSGDALTLLMIDHRLMEKLFIQFDKAKAGARKSELVRQIFRQLRLHMRVKEEVLYPAILSGPTDHEMVGEALNEHAAVRELMAEIEAMQPSEPLYDAKVTVLEEQVERQVEQEEEHDFPRLRRIGLDLMGVADRITARRAELTAQDAFA